jgi:hypothetical protein
VRIARRRTFDGRRLPAACRWAPSIRRADLRGAWQRGAPDDDAAFATYLANRGFVVFAVDYPRALLAVAGTDRRYPAALGWIREHGREYGGDAFAIGARRPFGGRTSRPGRRCTSWAYRQSAQWSATTAGRLDRRLSESRAGSARRAIDRDGTAWRHPGPDAGSLP